jgi:hypothetical protein
MGKTGGGEPEVARTQLVSIGADRDEPPSFQHEEALLERVPVAPDHSAWKKERNRRLQMDRTLRRPRIDGDFETVGSVVDTAIDDVAGANHRSWKSILWHLLLLPGCR